MKSKKKILIACLIIVFICVVSLVVSITVATKQAGAENLNTAESEKVQFEEIDYPPVNEKLFPTSAYKSDGYDNFAAWWTDLQGKRKSFEGQASVIIEELGAYLTDEEKQNLKTYEENIKSARSFAVIGENELLFNKIVDKARESAKTVNIQSNTEMLVDSWNCNNKDYYCPNNSGVLTKSGGVNYHNGRKETWYSSNVLYHYRTGEWTAGNDGVYRDSDGYVIVAASDLAQGSTVNTSYGVGKVYDTGCAPGTTDIYVNW